MRHVQAISGAYSNHGPADDPSIGNSFTNYLFQSGAPVPVVEAGTTLTYGTDVGRIYGLAGLDAPDLFRLGFGLNAGSEFYRAAKYANLVEFGDPAASVPLYAIMGPTLGWGTRWGGGASFELANPSKGYGALDSFAPATGMFTRSISAGPGANGTTPAFVVARQDSPTGSSLAVALPTTPGGQTFVGQVYFDLTLGKYRSFNGAMFDNLGAAALRALTALPPCIPALLVTKYIVTDAASPNIWRLSKAAERP